jgi:PLD-like domain
MQGALCRRLVGSVTALLVAISVALVTFTVAPSTASPARTAASSAAVQQVAPASAHHRQSAKKKAAARKAAAKKLAKRKKKAAAKKRAAAKKLAKRQKKAAKKLAKRQKKAAKKLAKRQKAARKRAEKRAHALRVARRWAKVKPRDPSTWITYAPDHYTPPSGPAFNDPYASRTRQRALLTEVIRSINSSPGYRTYNRRTKRVMPCPRNPRFYPSVIKVAVYSIADATFGDAIAAANKRCVSVQVLMNSHLTSVTSHSWGHIYRSLGERGPRWRTRRSFAHRCSNGCLGTSVLHSKIFLFSHAGRARNTVITGSSNMTTNATGVQWNDLFTVNDNAALYTVFANHFHQMVPDRMAQGPYVYQTGRYQATFYPFRRATRRTDSTVVALRTVKCAGATGGTGIGGHTVIYVAMHAWFGKRGSYITQQLRRLYERGCYVRILYSFMGHGTFSRLTTGTGHRMVVRRVLFPRPDMLTAAKYSHMKMLAVSGNVGGNPADEVVWTGSNNWTDRSNHGDEVTLRITSGRVYLAYVHHWRFMRERKSSAYWATYLEPQGGGRAP